MLTHMTKKTFIEGIDERRFVVRNVKGNRYEVLLMDAQDNGNGGQRFSISAVINPDTKDGLFHQSGGGYNKAHACIEDIARYVDRNAEDKDEDDSSCTQHFMYRQHYTELN
jgi:hypothetical protein